MNYEMLRYLPRINDVTVIGDMKLEDFGLIPASSNEIAELMLECYGFLL